MSANHHNSHAPLDQAEVVSTQAPNTTTLSYQLQLLNTSPLRPPIRRLRLPQPPKYTPPSISIVQKPQQRAIAHSPTLK